MEKTEYSYTSISKNDLEKILHNRIGIIDLQKIFSAYDMAESVHEYQFRNDGSPYFYHTTRTAKIMIDIAGVIDTDVLCACLLHDVLEDSPVLTKEVLEYNFGAYTAYLVELLTKDLAAQREQLTKIEEAFVKKLAESPIDALLIKLAARLDNFRCLQFHLKRNPFDYIQSTECHYFPLVEKSNSIAAKKLLRELKIERNKFLG
ncbi:MAG: HD domain-containing protein [Candidatus Kapabacteria bacterium]|jgi:(p)ppGpp synthase/HD superfamily hydrolase|nr:HD domain-containing protein [Candidatus Kapabacteria bacterium]